MICPSCGAEGRGPRFLKRHPSLCSQRSKEAAAKAAFTHQLAQGTRCVESVMDLLEDERSRLIHFAALSEIQPYQWINTDDEIEDLRKVPLPYARNIRDWMLKHSYKDTAYDDTPQFHFVNERINLFETYEAVAREALRRKL